MRPGGPSKQRLWLGARQYCNGCRSATTNADARNAYPYTYGDSMRGGNANANPDGDSDRHTYSYTNPNTDGYTYCNSYDDTNADTYPYSYAKGDTEDSPDTASAADSVGVRSQLSCSRLAMPAAP